MKLDAQQQQAILDRFNKDEGFRKRVLEDANKTVKEEFGVDLPFPMRVAMDATGYRIEPLTGTTDDLSDEQLELAAGGAGKSSGGGAPVHQDARRITIGGGIVGGCGGAHQ